MKSSLGRPLTTTHVDPELVVAHPAPSGYTSTEPFDLSHPQLAALTILDGCVTTAYLDASCRVIPVKSKSKYPSPDDGSTIEIVLLELPIISV